MPATEKKKTKTNYREECGPLAAGVQGLILVPGMDPNGNIIGYVKQEDGSLTEWDTWSTWRDASNFLAGYKRGTLDTASEYEDDE